MTSHTPSYFMTSNTPYKLYLSRLSASGRRAVHSQLNSIAAMMSWTYDEREQNFTTIDYALGLKLINMMQQQGWSARYINRGITAIKGIVKIAVLSGIASEKQSLQLQALPRLRHGEHPGTPLSQVQIKSLFSQLNSDRSLIGERDTLILTLFLGLGLRRSELQHIRIEDIDSKITSLVIHRGKGNKSRTCYIPEWVQQVIKGWLTLVNTDTGYLVCRVNKSGSILPAKSLTSSGIYKVVKMRLNMVDINASPHDLRRTFITRLLEQNVDLNTVRQMAGHADIATTIMYDKRDHAAMQQAASMLSYGQEGE